MTKTLKVIRDYLAAGLLGLVLVTPAMAVPKAPTAGLTITADYGGIVPQYIEKYNALKSVKGQLRLDGFCISACTLFLGIIPKDDACATPGSFFGFHSASFGTGDYADEATRLIWNIYPESVRERLKAEGWDGMSHQPHPDLIYVPALELMEACQ